MENGDSGVDEQKEDLISYIKNCTEKIARIDDKHERDIILFEMLHTLNEMSETFTEEEDYFEAAGMLCSAAYYLEEYYNNYAKRLYEKAIKYYNHHIHKMVRKGNIKEAGTIAIKIADLYRDKICSTSDEEKNVLRAIDFTKQEIEFMIAYDSAHDLALLFQKIGVLHERIHHFREAIVANQNVLKYAKRTKDFSLISNAYQNLSTSYMHAKDFGKAQDIMLEGMEYFSNLASKFEQNGELLMLSQIYQIMKRFYVFLRDKSHFILFSKKEAQVYLSLAKLSLIGDVPLVQVASYYRAAALCYKDTNKNNIEASTCFILSGNYYKDEKKYVEATINYMDSAELFEIMENYKKSYEYYIKSAECAILAFNKEIAIENYIRAIDLSEKAKINNEIAIKRLIELLEHYAIVQKSSQNCFVAATMYLEAAYYYFLLKKQNDAQFTDYILKSAKLYYESGISSNELRKHSDRVYALVLSVLCNYLLKNTSRIESIVKEISTGNSKTAKIYEKIMTLVMIKTEKLDVDIACLEPKERNLYSKSEELKKLIFLINKFY